MHLAQDNDVVHTFTPDRSDQPFGKAVLPGRGRCGRMAFGPTNPRRGFFSDFGPNAFLNETNQTRSLPRWRNQRRQADYVRNRFGFKKFFSAPRRGVPTCMAYLARFDPTAMIENWQQLPDGQIEFTMRRPPAAD
jgi:hypothetical protein